MVAAAGRYDEALPLLDEVLGVAGAETATLEEAEMQVKAAKVKGTVLQELGRSKEAAVWFELVVRGQNRALQLVPMDEDLGPHFAPLRYAHDQLVAFYLAAEAYHLAVEHFEQLLALADDPAERRLVFHEFERLALEHDFRPVRALVGWLTWWVNVRLSEPPDSY